MATRICPGCGEEKDCEADFYPQSKGHTYGTGRKDGKRSRCKPCTRGQYMEKTAPKRRLGFTCMACGVNYKRNGRLGSKTLCADCSAVGHFCGRCKQFKPHDRFYSFRTEKKGGRYCKDGCTRAAIREGLYKLPAGSADRLATECEICGATESSGKRKTLHVDHCHTTGVVRGVLCNVCNSAIGYFREDVGLLQAAIDYLKRNKAA